jgi:hypothetical protein
MKNPFVMWIYLAKALDDEISILHETLSTKLGLPITSITLHVTDWPSLLPGFRKTRQTFTELYFIPFL